jgi:predicted phage terminase large subunit-like protein
MSAAPRIEPEGISPERWRAASAVLPAGLAERARRLIAARRVRTLVGFVQQSWPIVEPRTPYIHGRHIEVICAHLEALARGEIEKLLENIPPRYMKSRLVAVFFPAWVWGPHGDPGARFIYASYKERLAMRDSLATRRIIESRWYQERWPGVRLLEDQNEKLRFDNTEGGFRLATSVEGGNTGEGADYVIADDPHNAKQIWSDAKRESVIEWWDDVMSSRTGRWATNRKIVVMQRLHEGDLSGHILAEKGDYVHLFLPQEYDPALRPGRAGVPAKSRPSPLGRIDWRTQPGELLWPERFPRPVVEAIKSGGITAYGYGGQYQQVPSPSEGGLFKRHLWRYWEPPDEDLGPIMKWRATKEGGRERYVVIPRKLPFELERYAQGWDFTFKGRDPNKERDYVAGQVWGKLRTDAFLFDRIYQQMDFVGTIRAIRAMSALWPEAERKYYEDAANGPAIESTLRGEIGGIIAVPVEGSLESRAHAVTWLQESGHLYLPHPVMCPWVIEFEEQLAAFPNAAHDDDIAAFVTVIRQFFPQPEPSAESTKVRGRRAYPIFQHT